MREVTRVQRACASAAPQSVVVQLIVLGGQVHDVRALVDEHACDNIAEGRKIAVDGGNDLQGSGAGLRRARRA